MFENVSFNCTAGGQFCVYFMLGAVLKLPTNLAIVPHEFRGNFANKLFGYFQVAKKLSLLFEAFQGQWDIGQAMVILLFKSISPPPQI